MAILATIMYICSSINTRSVPLSFEFDGQQTARDPPLATRKETRGKGRLAYCIHILPTFETDKYDADTETTAFGYTTAARTRKWLVLSHTKEVYM